MQIIQKSVSVTLDGVKFEKCLLISADRKGKCNLSGEWFQPGAEIIYKGVKFMTPAEKNVLKKNDPQGKLWPLTVLNAATTLDDDDWEPSEYQKAIFEAMFNSGEPFDENAFHIIIKALAGAAKTSTLVRGIKELAKPGLLAKALSTFLAFNSSIAKELVSKLLGTTCPARTTHSFCFQVLKKHFNLTHDSINDWRESELLQRLLCDDLGRDYDPASMSYVRETNVYKVARRAILKLVGLMKNYAVVPQLADNRWTFDNKADEIVAKLVKDYDIEAEVMEDSQKEPVPLADVIDYAKRIVAASLPKPGQNLTECSFDDMIYIPIALGLKFPNLHICLTDETQDFNNVQIEMLRRLAEAGTRIIAVGDENQAIYRFRGANAHAFSQIQEMLESTDRGVKEFELPVNYRCDRAIIRHAQELVPAIQGASEEEGEVTHVGPSDVVNRILEHQGKASVGIVCRVGKDLIFFVYRSLVPKRIKCQVIGKGALGDPLKNLIYQLCGEKPEDENYTNLIGNSEETTGLLTRLEEYYQVQKIKFEDERFARKLEEISEKVSCIREIAAHVKDNYVSSLIDEIESLFVQEEGATAKKDVVQLTTLHRAKGLEWDHVYTLRPDLLPHPLAQQFDDEGNMHDEYQQELNLMYMGRTRAKHYLAYVKEEINPQNDGLRQLSAIFDYGDAGDGLAPSLVGGGWADDSDEPF